MRYFVSDPHFSHSAIVNFERTEFKTIEEHDNYLAEQFNKWAQKLKPQDEFWVLGDWGNIEYLWVMNEFKCQTHFVYGNHDTAANKPEFATFFDQVHEYPVWLSNKLVISHIPVAVFEDTINVHGHLHGANLNSNNYVNCSLHMCNYRPITEQTINGRFGQLPKYDRRFLWEPFAHLMKFESPREDVITNKDNVIDLAASRVLQCLNRK